MKEDNLLFLLQRSDKDFTLYFGFHSFELRVGTLISRGMSFVASIKTRPYGDGAQGFASSGGDS